MNPQEPSNQLALPTRTAERIDRHCLAFEDAWQGDSEPDLQAWLEGWDGGERAQLFRELLLVEREYRRRRGEELSVSQYVARFPDYQSTIEELIGGRGASVSGELAAGRQVGRYVVEQRLGSGSFGFVYLAWDVELRRFVALKTPRTTDPANQDAVESFIEEARTVSRIDHPAIVPILDVVREPGGVPVLVMPYVEGCTLRDRIKIQPFTPAECVAILTQVADAIDFAHRRGFIHRDLKPHNILLDAEGRPHITDFGLALHEKDQYARAGESAGSLPYMSPEQLRGDSQWLDGRSDIWALGVILYEMLTRRLPFGGNGPDEMASEIFGRDPKPLRQIRDDISVDLERVCLTCLAKRTGDRFATARDFAEALRHAVATDACVGSPRRPLAKQGRRLTWIPCLATLAGIAAVYAVLQSPPLDGEGVTSPSAASLAAGTAVEDIELQVWSENDHFRGSIRRGVSAASPLHPGDKLRLSVRLSQPAYLYVFWIGTEGDVTPIHPWQPGNWSQRERDVPTDQIHLPPRPDESWPVKPGVAGNETVVVLVADRPWPRDLDVQAALQGGQSQAGSMLDEPQWFDNARLLASTASQTRSVQVGTPVNLKSPLIANQMLIAKCLAPYYLTMQAICFPIAGENP